MGTSYLIGNRYSLQFDNIMTFISYVEGGGGVDVADDMM